MKYFTRHPGSSTITGPYGFEEIAAQLKAGELSADALATGDIGESLAVVAQSPAEDWINVSQIPGLGANQIPSLDVPAVICPKCSHPFSGDVVPGETLCRECGQCLAPAVKKPAAPHFLIVFFVQVPVGFLVQFLSLVFLCGFISGGRGGDTTLIPTAIILCVVWIALGIRMVRNPTFRGYAFGVFLGVGLTALLTANCAMQSSR